ncbi:hypothetical protein ACQJBY_065754 [Aegilops geniculata]
MDPAGAGKGTAAAVCVTGAGGFIASWLVERLLAGGDYVVHGTVRDPSDPKNDHLRTLDGAGERLRLFKADVLDYASVASAVAGCAGVFHVASPCPAAKSTNPEVELLAPAVAGTLNVLRACREAGVCRVVVVSSAGAVFINPNPPEGPTMDEHCWSDEEYCRATELVLPLQDAGRARGLGLRGEDWARRGDRVPAAGARASAAAHGEHQQPVPHQIPEMRRRGRHGRRGEEHGGCQGRRQRPCAGVQEPGGGRPLHLQRTYQEGVRNGFRRQEPTSQPELSKRVRSDGGG